MIMRFRPANIRLINRRSTLPRLLLALSLTNAKSKNNDKNKPIDLQKLTGHSISGTISFDAVRHLLLCRIERTIAATGHAEISSPATGTTQAADYMSLLVAVCA
jgi:hypothetical protein